MNIDRNYKVTLIRALPYGFTLFLGLFMKAEMLTVKQFAVISIVHLLSGMAMWSASKFDNSDNSNIIN